jgi:hypothetical protein
MRPIKFIPPDKLIAYEGFLHAFVPRPNSGVDAVVEYAKSGEVTTVPADASHLRFDPTTEVMLKRQIEAQERQERMMAAISGNGVLPVGGGGRLLVPA